MKLNGMRNSVAGLERAEERRGEERRGEERRGEERYVNNQDLINPLSYYNRVL